MHTKTKYVFFAVIIKCISSRHCINHFDYLLYIIVCILLFFRIIQTLKYIWLLLLLLLLYTDAWVFLCLKIWSKRRLTKTNVLGGCMRLDNYFSISYFTMAWIALKKCVTKVNVAQEVLCRLFPNVRDLNHIHKYKSILDNIFSNNMRK